MSVMSIMREFRVEERRSGELVLLQQMPDPQNGRFIGHRGIRSSGIGR